MKRIPLRAQDGSTRAYALVDDADFAWLSQHRWSLSTERNRQYAVRAVYAGGGRVNQRQARYRMHREIMGLARGDRREVDHRDGDGLNNQRTNLRIVTHAQNLQNRVGATRANHSSGVRGVTWDKNRHKWMAQARLNGRNHHMGRYDTIEDAAAAVAKWRAVHMSHSEEDQRA